MVHERDILIAQVQSEIHQDKERLMQKWSLEKNLQQQSISTLKDDMSRLEKEFERLQSKLTMRETEVSKLCDDNASLIEKLDRYDAKRDEWRRSTKKLEEYFNVEIETIRNNFDLQLRDLLDKQRLEIDNYEEALT